MSAINAVINYALSKRISTEPFRQGLRTGTRASFQMEQTEAVQLLDFIMRKNDCTADEAVKLFVSSRDAMMQTTAKSPKGINFFTGLLLSSVLMVIPGMLLTMLEGSMWLKVALLALVIMLFFALVYSLAWNPRGRAKNAAWAEGGTFAEKLEKLWEVQNMPIPEMLQTYQKPQATVFAIVALACVIGFPALWGNSLAIAEEFHREMTAVAVSAENAGSRYVIFDVNDSRYIDKYLSDERQAVTAEDVRGVIRIKEEKQVVGRYQSQGNAYQRYVTIELIDQRTGMSIGTETVWGSEPPRSITVKAGTRNKDGYGSHPSDSQINAACERLIRKLEAMQ